jgi:hypothetical protein
VKGLTKGVGSTARTVVVAVVCALVVGATGAVAAQLITGKEIKNNTIAAKDLKKKLREKIGRSGTVGSPGQAGADGATGPQGPPGTATYSNPEWGVVDRNVIESAVSALRGGPYVPGSSGTPPFGVGSLGINVGNPNEKASFGNEVDFAGDEVADLAEVGYRVYTTGENNGLGNPNMPSITFEIDPNGAGGTSTGFSSLVWIPSANSTSNQWSGYIDATSDGFWGLTGSQFNSPATAENCGLNGPRCTFDQIQDFLATGTGATIYNAQVTKGRDFAFHGAVDGLRINETVFDFEPFGVTETTP